MWAAADLMSDARAPAPLVEVVPSVGPRLLLIAGREAEETAAARLLQGAAPAITVWSLPDTAHIQALATHPAGWEARVAAHLSDRLNDRVAPRQVP
jgi:hypothetical protein